MDGGRTGERERAGTNKCTPLGVACETSATTHNKTQNAGGQEHEKPGRRKTKQSTGRKDSKEGRRTENTATDGSGQVNTVARAWRARAKCTPLGVAG